MIYLVRMRPKFRAAAVALVLVGALSASGCASEAPSADPTPTPSATPLFASDEEALAAAEEAYAAYLAVTDEILHDGGIGSERLAVVAEGGALSQAVGDADEFRSNGWRTTGATILRSISLQSNDISAVPSDIVVRAYVCEDVAGIDLLDKAGMSLVSPDRQTVTPFEAAFVVPSVGDSLILAEREVWGDLGVCS